MKVLEAMLNRVAVSQIERLVVLDVVPNRSGPSFDSRLLGNLSADAVLLGTPHGWFLPVSLPECFGVGSPDF